MEVKKILISAICLLFIAGALSAACGTNLGTGAGICVGKVDVSCDAIKESGCCADMGCDWDMTGTCMLPVGQKEATPSGNIKLCKGFEAFGNKEKCEAAGCFWVSNSQLAGKYDAPCASDDDCPGGLVCKSGKCNQQDGTCDYAPSAYNYLAEETTENPDGKTLVGEVSKAEEGTGLVGAGGIYRVGWLSDWKAAGLIGIAIAVSIIALAAMAGHAFNLPEVKAFAHSEFSQAIISVLLIVFLFGIIQFLDVTSEMAVKSAGLPVSCDGSEPCYVLAAKSYLGTLYDVADAQAQNTLKEAIKKYRASSEGQSLQLNFWFLLYAGTSVRNNAGLSIDAERQTSVFDTISKMMAGISAQKYFIDVVSFGIAPIFLLFGIILRTFFFTRKLGGLLLAIAISLFVVYPLCYAFAWFTLNVTVYGERTFGPATDANCPAECTTTYPVAYYVEEGRLVQFSTTQDLLLSGVTQFNWETGADGKFQGLVACTDLSSAFKIKKNGGTAPANSCEGCPDYCRQVPYPAGLPGCNIAACSKCNAGCKIMRLREDCKALCNLGSCPIDTCRTKLPVEDKCYLEYDNATTTPIPRVAADLSVTCEGCNGCPNWCRMLIEDGNGGYTLKYKDNKFCQVDSCKISNCPVKCMYSTKITSSTSCEQACSGCPKWCRLTGSSKNAIIAGGFDIGINWGLCSGCAGCAEGCRIEADTTPPSGCAYYPSTAHVSSGCADCPKYCRFDDYGFIGSSSNALMLPYSKQQGAPLVPSVCTFGIEGRLDCGSSACPSGCLAQAYPAICKDYDALAPAGAGECQACPLDARLKVSHLGPGCLGSNQMCGMSAAGCCGLPNGLYCDVQSDMCTQCAGVGSSCNYGNECCFGLSCDQNSKTCVNANAPPNTGLYGDSCGTSSDCVPNLICSNGACDCRAVGGTCAAGETCCSGLACDQSTNECAPAATALPIIEPIELSAQYATPCTAPSCEDSCLPVKSIPVDQSCKPYNKGGSAQDCELCPYGCRVNMATLNVLDLGICDPAYCDSGACPDACKVDGGTQSHDGPICSEYIGNGASASSGYCFENAKTIQAGCLGTCGSIIGMDNCKADACCKWADYECKPIANYAGCSAMDAAACKSNPAQCKLEEKYGCFGSGNGFCNSYATEKDCKGHVCKWDGSSCGGSSKCAGLGETDCLAGAHCDWLPTASSLVPIDERAIPFDARDACRQCPENCRLSGISTDCGLPSSSVDCTINCPEDCRVEIPQSSSCQDLSPPFGGSCEGCPLMCRSNNPPPGCTATGCAKYSEVTGLGCKEECYLGDTPKKICAGCMACPFDCMFYPAVRTDCSEVCSDEALAGPLSVGPDDFVKKLPGAMGASDVKAAGLLMIPALVMPLFCIVMVVAFIRVLSPMLGGDIEIPGLSRLI